MRVWSNSCFGRVLAGVVAKGYAGYDPYDGLNSRPVRWLALDRIRPLARVIQQVVKRLPFNIRPLLLFDYYDVNALIKQGFNWGDAALLTAVGLLYGAVAWWFVDKKELGV